MSDWEREIAPDPWLFCACDAYALDEDAQRPAVFGTDGIVHEPDMCWRACRGECGRPAERDGYCHETHSLSQVSGRIVAERPTRSLPNQDPHADAPRET